MFLARSQCVITIHSGEFVREFQRTRVPGFLKHRFLASFGHVIAINDEVANFFMMHHPEIEVHRAKTYVALKPIGPPIADRGTGDAAGVATIVMNGLGRRVYQFEQGIRVCEMLRENGRQARLVIFLYGGIDEDYVRAIRSYPTSVDVEVRRHETHDTFVTELRQATLYLRTTSEDGYGVAIAEAVENGVPAIASDVCERPEGCLTYPSNDLPRAYSLARSILEDYPGHVTRCLEVGRANDNFARIREVYDRIASTLPPVHGPG